LNNNGIFDFRDFNTLENNWVSYSGEFKCSLMHGLGTLFLNTGEKFLGNFTNGKV